MLVRAGRRRSYSLKILLIVANIDQKFAESIVLYAAASRVLGSRPVP